MKKMILSLLIAFVASNANAYDLISSELVGVPWYQSTVMGAYAKPKTSKYFNLAVYPKVARYLKPKDNPGADQNLEVISYLRAHVWRTSKSEIKGLYIVIPGTGATATASAANLLAEQVTQLGYDAVVVTNPFSTDFQETFSSDGFVGFPQKDIKDTVEMVESAVDAYRSYYGEPKEINVTGYSLGALYTVMLADSNISYKLNKFIALNPPFEFLYDMNRLDTMIKIPGYGRNEIIDIIKKLIRVFTKTISGLTKELIGEIKTTLPTDQKSNEKIIGTSFRFSMEGVINNIISHDFVRDYDSRKEIFRITRDTSFARYSLVLRDYLVEEGKLENLSVSELAAKNNLLTVLKKSKRLKDIYFVSNEDDFLLQAGDLNDLEKVVGDKLHVFEAGGHCGNYWTPSFQNLFKELILK